MTWRAPRDGRSGRPPVFSDEEDQKTIRGTVFPTNAIQFCLSIKILFKLPLRQTVGMVASLLRFAGLDWPAPDVSALCRRQKTLAVQIQCRRADAPLNLLVDSTGIKFLGDGEWKAAETHIRISVMNRFSALGTAEVERATLRQRGKGKSHLMRG